jgi:hypothetical protein
MEEEEEDDDDDDDEIEHSPPPSALVKNEWILPPLYLCLFGVQRDNLTFHGTR